LPLEGVLDVGIEMTINLPGHCISMAQHYFSSKYDKTPVQIFELAAIRIQVTVCPGEGACDLIF